VRFSPKYGRLAEQIADPTASVMLALVARETELDRSFLQRFVSGALDALAYPGPYSRLQRR
jgi:hypothetical protein